MTITGHVILVAIALICFAIAFIGMLIPTWKTERLGVVALGLFCWLAAATFVT